SPSPRRLTVVQDWFFFFQAEDGIRDFHVTGVHTCALPLYSASCWSWACWSACCRRSRKSTRRRCRSCPSSSPRSRYSPSQVPGCWPRWSTSSAKPCCPSPVSRFDRPRAMITFTEAQLAAWISPLFWPFLRVLAVFSSAPVFSARSVPMRTRVALALLVAIGAQASLGEQPVIALDDARALAAVVQQVVVGVAIGLAV